MEFNHSFSVALNWLKSFQREYSPTKTHPCSLSHLRGLKSISHLSLNKLKTKKLRRQVSFANLLACYSTLILLSSFAWTRTGENLIAKIGEKINLLYGKSSNTRAASHSFGDLSPGAFRNHKSHAMFVLMMLTIPWINIFLFIKKYFSGEKNHGRNERKYSNNIATECKHFPSKMKNTVAFRLISPIVRHGFFLT